MKKEYPPTKLCLMCSKKQGVDVFHNHDQFHKDLAKKDGLRASCAIWTNLQQTKYAASKLKQDDTIILPEESKTWAFHLCNMWLRKKDWKVM